MSTRSTAKVESRRQSHVSALKHPMLLVRVSKLQAFPGKPGAGVDVGPWSAGYVPVCYSFKTATNPPLVAADLAARNKQ